LKLQKNSQQQQQQQQQQQDSELDEIQRVEPITKLRNSKLLMKIQEILAHYVTIEQYFMFQSIKKVHLFYSSTKSSLFCIYETK
jgi:hypothetical protein